MTGSIGEQTARLLALVVIILAAACGPEPDGTPDDPVAPDPGDDPPVQPEHPFTPPPFEPPPFERPAIPPELLTPAALPALVISEAALASSLSIAWVEVDAAACNVSDRCVAGGGWRRLLGVEIVIQNLGDASIVLYDPSEGDPLLEADACRDHSRLRVAPLFELFDVSGKLVRQVRVRSRCWYDEHPVDAGAGPAVHTCETPGLSPGWAFRSVEADDCQLVDVTDLVPGDYRLRVTLDPDGLIEQSEDGGNVAEVTVTLQAAEDDPLCVDDACYVPQPGACAEVSCEAEPATLECDAHRLVRVESPGLCHPETGSCIVHQEEVEDCGALGLWCVDGACIDPCEGVDCGSDTVACIDDETRRHVEAGSCDPETGTCTDATVREEACPEDHRCEGAVCVPPAGLPDLVIDGRRLAHSHFVEWAHFEPDDCAIDHGCIDAPGWRRLLRFTTVIENRGTAPAVIGSPYDNPEWTYDTCRRQYQWQNDTLQALLDVDGHEVTRTFKQSFCLYDVHPIPGWPDPPEAQHPAGGDTCRNNQGITHGWVDVYHHSLHCQWIDVTGIPPGTYFLEVTVNTEGFVEELDHDNNTGRAQVEIPATEGPPEP